MNPNRFDTLTKDLAQTPSRRTVLRGIGGATLSALGLAGLTRDVGAAPGSNSACVDFCRTVYSDSKAAARCIRDAAQGGGLCITCGADPTDCFPCGTSADCPTGLVCDGTDHVCRGCTDRSECAPLDDLGNRFCQPLADGSGRSICTNFLLCTCPGTCEDCGSDHACFNTGGGACSDANLCCPPAPAL